MSEPRDTPNPGTSSRPGRSSSKVDGEGGGKKKLLPILLGLLLLLLLIALLLFFLLRDGDDTEQALTPAVSPSVSATQSPTEPTATLSPSTSPTTGTSPTVGTSPTPAASTPPATTPPPAGSGATTGTLLAGEQDVVAAAGANALAPLVDMPVTGTAVVQEVVSDEGFWVGSSAEQRAFVYLTPEARGGGGESQAQVTAGDTVTLMGTVAALGAQPQATDGVTDAEGLAQLTEQDALVLATSYTLS